jgi:hypothetical protein
MRAFIPTAILSVTLSVPLPCAAQRSASACSFHRYRTVEIAGPMRAEVIRAGDPRYPAAALSERIQGDVYVQVLVNRKGKVLKACAYQGPAALRAAARRAALALAGSKFTTLGGSPAVEMIRRAKTRYLEGHVVIRFTLWPE